jgi:hypothetical protein
MTVVDLLVQDFGTITFKDVVDFCDQKIVENTELDYKMVIPRDLAKHFAAMSNRYGGLIIIGVKEDQAGLPDTYDGIPYNGKLIDQIHQIAGNVRPLPTYNVRTTDQVNGKVFLLIRINEGGAPPYTPINDPTVYLRTGNVTKPLGPADVETLRELHAKRDKAEVERRYNVTRAEAVLLSLLEQHDLKSRQKVPPGTVTIGSDALFGPRVLDEKFPMLTTYFQPFYPSRELALPREVSSLLGETRIRGQQDPGWSFPSMNMKPTARGLYDCRFMRDDSFVTDLLYANGMFMRSEHIGPSQGERAENIFLSDIGRLLYASLLFGRKLYGKLGYSGLVCGAIRLTGAQGRPLSFLSQNEFYARDAEAISPSYVWPIEADTHKLGDDTWMRQNFRSTMREIYWDLGVEDVQNWTFDQFLGEWRFT